MKQFSPYPIFTNNPGSWEEVRARQRYDFAARGDVKMKNWLDYTGKRLYEIMPDPNPDRRVLAYEQRVIELLELMRGTTLAKVMFNTMNKALKYWIIPLDYLDKHKCKCAAYTFPGAPKEGGGIRMYFNPSDFTFTQKNLQGGDDILFHELVHAYRMGRLGYAGLRKIPMNTATDAEEFFALHMQNVYLADRGGKLFYKAYKGLDVVSKNDAYDFLAGDPEAIMAFRYFVETDKDPLAVAVSRWKSPPDSFNPFRDYPALEQQYLKNLDDPAIKRLPPF